MNGGMIGRRNVPGIDGISGVWSMREIADAVRAGAWPVPDPYFSNVVAGLHMDGVNGSTTFTDVKGHTFTANGNAQISTAQSKFGGASAVFDGNGDYISTPSSSDFAYGTGDFTWEFFVRFNLFSGNQYLLDHGDNGGSILYVTGLRYYNPGTGTGSPLYTAAPILNTNKWYHIAVSRNSGTTKLFLDGTLISYAPDTYDYTANTLRIGSRGSNINFLNGYIDEFRITKGVGRYTENFQPPPFTFIET